MCIRDDEGRLLLAMTLWSQPICFTENGEVMRLLHVINLVHDLHLNNVDFELDAKIVVYYFNNGNHNIRKFGTILDECKRCCNLFFTNSHVEFSRRQAIEVTYTLAREATVLTSLHIFVDVPSCQFRHSKFRWAQIH